MTNRPPPFHRSHSGTYAFVFVAVITLMAVLLVVWNVQHRTALFKQSQQQIAEAAALSASNEIELLISEKRRLVRLFADQHGDEITRLAHDPDNDELRQRFEDQVAKFFPGFFAVTITNNSGTPLLADFDQVIGDVCLTDIRSFSHNGYLQDLFVHPHPDGYHFDIMTPWRSGPGELGKGTFFVSFKLTGISRLLQHGELKNHRLLLVKRSDPDLVEISADGGRNQMDRPQRLSDAELSAVAYSRPIPGTLWDIIALPDADALTAFQSMVNREAIGVMALFLLACAIMLYLVGQSEHYRGRSEQALIDSNRQLNITIDHLRETQQQLIESEKLAALGSLVKGVTHQINTPLGVGVTAATHLQEEVRTLARQLQDDKLTRSALQHFVDTAQLANQMLVANLERATRLMRSFKQVASDQSEQNRESFQLFDCLEAVTVSLRPRLQDGRYRIELDCPPNINMNSFPSALSQTITQLAINALQHGFGEQASGTLSIRCRSNDGRLRITLKDDGHGMEPEVLARVFDPFVTTNRGQGSVGLGLHIAYNLVTGALGGRINCESSPGGGTSLYLDLPLQAPELQTASNRARVRAARAS